MKEEEDEKGKNVKIGCGALIIAFVVISLLDLGGGVAIMLYILAGTIAIVYFTGGGA